ncbi:peptidoglycan recognition protein family protein [Gimesia fumaroli]|uniref:N-acetylmuramoyl-L-alanine amidase n=1 Tax=Gimesia fumaroli TaxID=2527976 RepID=A0A518IJ84_9PLAN|nr:peptidoglycan recognition family protein [Gimesia fumaroli]QDV53154.1 N-acetylmuramoyl-L-alanine amidase [Gimesia fumaroli]
MKGIIMCCVAMLPAIEISGCTQQTSLPPVTINSPSPMPEYPPVAAKPVPPGAPLFTTPPTIAIEPQNPWKPEAEVRDWEYIVIHHTASSKGSVESIHELHSKKKDKSGNSWLGIGYHFVIGNGNGMPDGAIEPTFRWREQMHGAHAGNNKYNQQGIGVCLVGNFEEAPPTEAQLAAVKKLVGVLKAEYKITGENVQGHRDVKATACPGKYFPMSEVAAAVDLPVYGATSPQTTVRPAKLELAQE